MGYVFSIFVFLSASLLGAPKSDIKEFLKKTGYENPHLIKLGSGAYHTLDAIHSRIVKLEKEVASPSLSSEEKKNKETLLRRSRVQYRLAFGILKTFAQMSLKEFDLRHLQEDVKTKHLFHDPTPENDKEIKRQVMNRAAEFYLGYLALGSLRQTPVVSELIFAWLDRKEFSLKTPEEQMVLTFFNDIGMGDLQVAVKQPNQKSLVSDKKYPIELFRNKVRTNKKDANGNYIEEDKTFFVIPTAINVANGFKKLVNSTEAQALKQYNLSEPTPAEEEGLTKLVLKQHAEDKRLRGYVTLYLDVLGTLIDAYNDFTHDSYDLNRITLSVLFRHILDIDGIEAALDANKDGKLSLEEAEQYMPFPPNEATPTAPFSHYLPVKNIVHQSSMILKSYFMNDTQHGPRLSDAIDNKVAREQEWRTYHGSLLKDYFGKDVRHWVWPLSQAVKDKKGKIVDPRVALTVDYKDQNGKRQWQGRDKNWNAPLELSELQDGDLWTEKGTGMGSDLIALATEPATPNERTQSYIADPSAWGVVKGKLYYKLTGAIGWLGDQGQYAQLATKMIKPTEYPGKNVDYTGISHTGIVETYQDDQYPQLSRADFVDAFPNMMRQAWRGHGCGHRHSRKCVWFRLREDWTENFVKNFATEKVKLLQQELPVLRNRVHWYRSEVIGNSPEESENLCRHFTTQKLKWTNEEEMMADRDHQRPAYNYCMAVFRARGMRNFETEVLSKLGAQKLSTAQMIRAIGKLVVEKAHNIRNQKGFEKGFGVRFDDRFDSFTKGQLYCSEHAQFAYLLAIGADTYPDSKFIKPAKKLLSLLSEEWVSTVSNGFIKVPFGEDDRVYAPQELFSPKGMNIWRVIGEMRRGYFGEHDE